MANCQGSGNVPGRVKLLLHPGKLHLCFRSPWAVLVSHVLLLISEEHTESMARHVGRL